MCVCVWRGASPRCVVIFSVHSIFLCSECVSKTLTREIQCLYMCIRDFPCSRCIRCTVTSLHIIIIDHETKCYFSVSVRCVMMSICGLIVDQWFKKCFLLTSRKKLFKFRVYMSSFRWQRRLCICRFRVAASSVPWGHTHTHLHVYIDLTCQCVMTSISIPSTYWFLLCK